MLPRAHGLTLTHAHQREVKVWVRTSPSAGSPGGACSSGLEQGRRSPGPPPSSRACARRHSPRTTRGTVTPRVRRVCPTRVRPPLSSAPASLRCGLPTGRASARSRGFVRTPDSALTTPAARPGRPAFSRAARRDRGASPGPARCRAAKDPWVRLQPGLARRQASRTATTADDEGSLRKGALVVMIPFGSIF
jgi:hypothetical protein